jgi:hypothetical protein
MHISNRIPNRTHTFVDPYVMENTSLTTEQEFIERYQKWIDSKPTSDEVAFVEYNHICILKEDLDDELITTNTVFCHINNVNGPNTLRIANEISKEVIKSFKNQIVKALKKTLI